MATLAISCRSGDKAFILANIIIGRRTHFFWTSGTQFLGAIRRWPEIRERWHGAGPGRTWRTVRDTLGPSARARVWLDVESWQQEVVG